MSDNSRARAPELSLPGPDPERRRRADSDELEDNEPPTPAYQQNASSQLTLPPEYAAYVNTSVSGNDHANGNDGRRYRNQNQPLLGGRHRNGTYSSAESGSSGSNPTAPVGDSSLDIRSPDEEAPSRRFSLEPHSEGGLEESARDVRDDATPRRSMTTRRPMFHLGPSDDKESPSESFTDAPGRQLRDDGPRLPQGRLEPLRVQTSPSPSASKQPMTVESAPELGQNTVIKGRVHYPDEHGLGALDRGDVDEQLYHHAGRGQDDSARPGLHNRTSSFAVDDDGIGANELYDWSDEDDLVDQEAKFEDHLNPGITKSKKWGFKRVVVFFLSTLIGSTILAGIFVTPPLVLHFFYYKPHPTDHRRWVSDNVSAWLYWAAANLVISWFLAFIVNMLPNIATWIVGVFWGSITEQFKSYITAFETFKGWIKPILYAASGWASWAIIFSNIYKLHDQSSSVKSRAAYTDRLYQVVELAFFLVVILSIEKIFLQVIAFVFHRTAFQERLEEISNALRVLDVLQDYKPKKRPRSALVSAMAGGRRTPNNFATVTTSGENTPGGLFSRSRPVTPHRDLGMAEEGFAQHGSEDMTPSNSNTHPFTRPKSWFGVGGNGKQPGTSIPMTPAGVSSPIRSADTSRAPSRNASQELNGVLNQNAGHTYPPAKTGEHVEGEGDDNGVKHAAKIIKHAVLLDTRNIKQKTEVAGSLSSTINSPSQAKKVARNLYNAFRADRRRTYLIPSDFYPAFNTPEDAKAAFKVFDKDGNDNITRAEIKTTVLKVYKERRFLARSLQDVQSALSTLDSIMMVFGLIIVGFISLSVFDINYGKSLTSFYTVGIAASFIFRNAASNAFDAVIFLFVTHPYDTGDRCFIDTENLVVKKMGLFATTFTRADGTSTYYYNSQLFSKFITNARRSGKTVENLTMQVNWRTPIEKLDQLEKAMNHWIQTDDNRWFSGDTSIILQHIDWQRSMELTILITHNSNWQDWGGYLTRHTAFHAACNYYSNKLGISWAGSPQPVLITSAEDSYDPPLQSYLDGAEDGDETLLDASPNIAGGATPNATATGFTQPAAFFLPPKDESTTQPYLRSRKSRKAAAAGVVG